jgi:hypothetical protein
LPSASSKTLGEIKTLGKVALCRVLKIKHSAKELFVECCR